MGVPISRYFCGQAAHSKDSTDTNVAISTQMAKPSVHREVDLSGLSRLLCMRAVSTYPGRRIEHTVSISWVLDRTAGTHPEQHINFPIKMPIRCKIAF